MNYSRINLFFPALFLFVNSSTLIISALFFSAALFAFLYFKRKKGPAGREAELKSAEEIENPVPEDKMAYVGTVAAGLAHEIRNPLNAIDFNIRMIQEDIESGNWNKNDINGKFKSTYKEIKHLERLVNDFLLYAGKKGLRFDQTDIKKMLHSVKGLLSEQAMTKSTEIILEIENSLPMIEADSEVLRQAIFNIAKNGIEAIDQGGSLLLKASSIPGKKIVEIKITDTGKGILPYDLKKIFHLFYSTRRSGTGLGLPVAKSIIENHNGWIEVDSKPAKGTTFAIFLPAEQKGQKTNEK